MPYYTRCGQVPHKRHTQFRKTDGSLHAEQLFSTEGFSNDYSLLYHLYPPTQILKTGKQTDLSPVAADTHQLQHRSFEGFAIPKGGNWLESRTVLLFNKDCSIALAAPAEGTGKQFYKNADCDEMVFVHEGTGTMTSQYGTLDFSPGDYIIIPRGTIHQFDFTSAGNRLMVVESRSPFRFPKRYLSKYGQLLEHAPFCERDIRVPAYMHPRDEQGSFVITTKKAGILYELFYGTHPFDVVGWDGCCYPYIFSIHDFEPITGRVHQPPPVHQTFETDAFVVCSFVPRLYDYHPDAIPAPYHHSNIDSDEVLYYVDGDFMSRNHITRGMITLHPAGIPHGPHPGAVERSIGKKATEELAVMVDTFSPLFVSKAAVKIEQPDYTLTWREHE
jgi:homogentisate 1,2-dioxygenase